ncbi:MAG: ferritin family protein [Sedimentisphaerales bacterium]
MKPFKSFHEVIDFAINQEIEAAKFYKILADFVEQPEMAEVLSDLALQELGHKAKLEAVGAGRANLDDEEISDLGIVNKVDDVVPDAKMDYTDLLVIGMKKEEAARKLYTDLARAAQTKQIRDIFLQLSKEEAQHKMRFELEYELITF